jgi:hypothetical protein
MDFIVKLPKSPEPMIRSEYDSIIVTTNKLTKQAYFILVNETITAEELAYVYYRYIWSEHGTLEEMITDRRI